ncbi:MAG: efflux RND transporter periplasmic adaptor subunit [Pseudomonadota bacterium]
MRISSLIAAALIVAGLGYWFVLRHGGEEAQAAVEPADAPVAETQRAATPVPVQVFTSQAVEHQGELLLKGRTEANRNVHVAAETTGRVISDPLRRGAEVQAGQVLCELDPGVRAAELAEAEASLAEARVDASASKQLKSKGFTAETTLRSAEARLQAAEARLGKVQWDIQQLAIRAPFDGILETDTAELGTFLSPGTACANVIDLTKIKVTAFVAEQDVEALSLRQAARIRLINGATAEGEITFLSRVADQNTRTYTVEVTLDNPDAKLRDGMTAELAIALPTRKIHRIPQSALTLNDAGTLGVRVADAGTARFLPVSIIGEAPEYIRITGLPDTADIIVVGQEFVRDGRAVEATQFQLPAGLTQ